MTMRRAMVAQCVVIALGVALVVSGVRHHQWFYVAVGALCIAVFGTAFALYAVHLLRHRAGPTVSISQPRNDALPPGVARLVFFRTRAGGDNLRKYRVDVDGRSVGVLAPDSSLTVDVEPGPHTCRARIDWSGSPTSSLEPTAGQVIRIHVARAARPSFGTQGWLVLDYTSSDN
jgi:hypothetical protein